MKRSLIFSQFLFWTELAAAGVTIRSCDETYTAKIDVRGTLVIKRDTRIVNSIKIDHDVLGGVFSLDNSLLIVYGAPNKIDPVYPQVTHLSLYAVGEHRRTLVKEVYGGGVYGVAFSTDQRFASVENQFGIDVLNVRAKTTQSFDPTYVVGFSTQQCPTELK